MFDVWRNELLEVLPFYLAMEFVDQRINFINNMPLSLHPVTIVGPGETSSSTRKNFTPTLPPAPQLHRRCEFPPGIPSQKFTQRRPCNLSTKDYSPDVRLPLDLGRRTAFDLTPQPRETQRVQRQGRVVRRVGIGRGERRRLAAILDGGGRGRGRRGRRRRRHGIGGVGDQGRNVERHQRQRRGGWLIMGRRR